MTTAMQHGAPRYVITGPSGWIGQALLAQLELTFGPALSSHVALFASGARQQYLPSGRQLPVRALDTIRPADVDGARVIHLAYLTKEKVDQLGEQRFVATNRAIDGAVLDAMSVAAPASVFVASSGAAALTAGGANSHPYGLTKLHQEQRFLEAAVRSGVPTIAGRIFNLAGPYINKQAAYAVSNFALQARETGRIRIEATVPVFRSYLHVGDLCSIIVAAADRAAYLPGPIDLCGGEIVEMDDLARIVARAVGGDCLIDRAPIDYSASSSYLGDFTKSKALAMYLGVELAGLDRQVRDTVAWVNFNRASGVNCECDAA